MTRKIHFGLHPYGVGGPGQDGLWKDARVAKNSSIDINYYIAQAKLAERGLFDAFFIVDSQFINASYPPHYLNRLEPLTLLSAVAVHTTHIGLVGTLSSTYNSPFNLARRLASKIGEIRGAVPHLGFLNINLYRDDDVARELPESEIRHSITECTVVLVDDVLYTGRTIRAALDAVTDLGRPRAIRLAVLIDRGLRELPIQADYIGKTIPTSRREHIDVAVAAQRADADSVTVSDADRAGA